MQCIHPIPGSSSCVLVYIMTTVLLPNLVLGLFGTNDFLEFIKFLIFRSIVRDLSLIECWKSVPRARARGAIAGASVVQSNCTRNMGDEERGLDKAGA